MKIARVGLTSEHQIREMREELARMDTPAFRKKYKRKKIMTAISNSILAVIILCGLLMIYQMQTTKAQGKAPVVFGYSLYNVTTGSMIPTLEVGSVFITQEYKGGELAKDTIVVFNNDDYDLSIAHRIVEVLHDEDGNLCYRTKGDNPNNAIDPELLYPRQIEAVFVFKLPFLG